MTQFTVAAEDTKIISSTPVSQKNRNQDDINKLSKATIKTEVIKKDSLIINKI
jgi:hypothetical protein